MRLRPALLVGLAACLTPSAFASITLHFDGTHEGQNIDMVYNGSAHTVYAGLLNFTDQTNNVLLRLYCADLDHFISGGQVYDVDPVSTIGLGALEVAGSVCSNSYYTVASDDSATALQIAIWASLYGTDLSTNSGPSFQLDGTWYSNHGSIISSAIAMVNLGVSNPMAATYYKPLPSDAGQAQLGPVPEPASFLAVGAGLAALARRSKKKA